MARPLAFAVALVGVVSLFPTAQGCTRDTKDCSNIRASNYDQSCTFDSDCVDFIAPSACCPGAAISAAAQAQYMNDFAGCAREGCTAACTNEGPCCISGACQFTTALDCHQPIPATDAAVDAATDAGAE